MPSMPDYETIRKKENELARCIREFSGRNPEYASLRSVVTATIESVQQLLSSETTVVEYFLARTEKHLERMTAFVNRKRK